jgi:hypothetical protein
MRHGIASQHEHRPIAPRQHEHRAVAPRLAVVVVCDGAVPIDLGSVNENAGRARTGDRWRRMATVMNPPGMSRSERSDLPPYPFWSDRCWISMAAESADGTGPRVGRVISRETNCPDGKPQRLGQLLGFRERNVGELELRVVLGPGNGGVCQVIVEERDDEVYVRVLLHWQDEDHAPVHCICREIDCPVRVWLDQPLGERAVIDVDRDEALPLYEPRYVNNVPNPDHGYHPAPRRSRKHRHRRAS